MKGPLALDPEWASWAHRIEFHLDVVPTLILHARHAATGIAAGRNDRPKVSMSRGTDMPAPLRGDAADDADELWTALVGYTVAAWRGMVQRTPVPWRTPALPHVLRATWWTEGEVLGVQAALSPDLARDHALVVIGWLLKHIEGLAAVEELEAREDALLDLIRRQRGRYGSPRPRRSRRRPCSVCKETTVEVDYLAPPGIKLGPAEPIGRCSTCGAEYVLLKRSYETPAKVMELEA